MRHGHLLGFHLLTLFLIFSRESIYLISSATKLQIIGPYLTEFDPVNIILTCGMTKSYFERKLYELLFRVNKSLKIV